MMSISYSAAWSWTQLFYHGTLDNQKFCLPLSSANLTTSI